MIKHPHHFSFILSTSSYWARIILCHVFLLMSMFYQFFQFLIIKGSHCNDNLPYFPFHRSRIIIIIIIIIIRVVIPKFKRLGRKLNFAMGWKFYSKQHHSNVKWNEYVKLSLAITKSPVKKHFNGKCTVCTSPSHDRNGMFCFFKW